MNLKESRTIRILAIVNVSILSVFILCIFFQCIGEIDKGLRINVKILEDKKMNKVVTVRCC